MIATQVEKFYFDTARVKTYFHTPIKCIYIKTCFKLVQPFLRKPSMRSDSFAWFADIKHVNPL